MLAFLCTRIHAYNKQKDFQIHLAHNFRKRLQISSTQIAFITSLSPTVSYLNNSTGNDTKLHFIFSRKCWNFVYFCANIAKIVQPLPISRKSPNYVADKFCIFEKNWRKKSTSFNCRENFRHFRIVVNRTSIICFSSCWVHRLPSQNCLNRGVLHSVYEVPTETEDLWTASFYSSLYLQTSQAPL